jgi:hypothetical protein
VKYGRFPSQLCETMLGWAPMRLSYTWVGWKGSRMSKSRTLPSVKVSTQSQSSLLNKPMQCRRNRPISVGLGTLTIGAHTMRASYALVVLLSGPGNKGMSSAGMGDYDTAAQCEEARVAAIDYWDRTHPPGYRVKFGAECIMTLDAWD